MPRKAPGAEPRLIGTSPQIETVRRLIDRAARTRLPVLVLGESGTGKEVVARSIYEAAPRNRFVPIDCGSLVGGLMESDLFGHTRGAFSGAVEKKPGLVELADGGTAFFDEIGDLPLELQVKLLRLLQEHEFRPVGSLRWHKVDLRIIAATHRDLPRLLKEHRFREDLYYRLNVIVIRVPPLRERRQDIPLLLRHFLGAAGWKGDVDPDTVATICSYDWPGNVRELKNCAERMVAVTNGPALLPADLPTALHNFRIPDALPLRVPLVEERDPSRLPVFEMLVRHPIASIRDTERKAICSALEATGGDRSRAAKALGIGRTTLYRKMKALGLLPPAV
jgi:DNA-binding NtrC family response regulator